MTDLNKKQQPEFDPYFEEVKTKTTISFDFVLWFYRILKYWYLFVISVAIFTAYAYIKNKSWVPYYPIRAQMLLEDRSSASIVSGSVTWGSILRNTENQKIVLGSYDMTQRTVDNLPTKMFVDYYIQTRFKKISLYSDPPVEIVIDSLSDIRPQAYNYVYTLSYVDQQNCRISYKTSPEDESEVSFIVPLNQEINNELFKVTFRKTPYFRTDLDSFKPELLSYNFRFMSKGELTGMYYGAIGSNVPVDGSTVLEISMSGNDPARCLDYMNTLLSSFEEYNLKLKNQQADLTISFIDNQLKTISNSLQDSRVELENFQKTTGVYEVESQQLRQQLRVADAERDTLAIRERSLLSVSEKIKDDITGSKPLIDPASLRVSSPKLNAAVARYNALLERYKNIGEASPVYPRIADDLNEIRKEILQELILAQVILQDKKDELVSKYMELELKLENLPPQERDFVKFQRAYDVNLMYEQYLSQRRQEASLQRASNMPDNTIFDKPRVVGGPINGGETSQRYMYFFLIGLVIPLVFVVVKEEILNFSIMTKEDCERISGLPVIGTIENISKKLSNGVVLVKNYPKSSFAESFRNMRVRIEYMAQRENKITMLVTSTEPADGKTFIATNVASVYQLMGKKVIIVDLDLRRPSVSKTLQIDSQKGISNYLIGQVELEDIIVSHPDYGFDIIPAGTLPPNPSELIKTAKTRQLLEHLKEEYDYVVVDCSPVGLVSDAYILSEMVDTTLFVVRRAKTNKSFFKSVITQLRSDGVENVALVFNDVKGREGYYGTSRYYGDKTYYLKKNSYYHDDYFEN